MHSFFSTSRKEGLSRRLGWLGGIAVVLSATMAAIIMWSSYQATVKASTDARILREVYVVLEASIRLSAERGPSNILMTSQNVSGDMARDHLQRSRNQTDTALQHLSAAIPAALLDTIFLRLKYARLQVDRVASARKPGQQDIQHAIESMFIASDTLHEIFLWKFSASWFHEDRTLVGTLQRAFALAQLRDTAGRLGSWLIAPMYSAVPLPSRTLDELSRADEKIEMLWRFLTPAENLPYSESENLITLQENARMRFFDVGRPMINQLIREGKLGQGYSYSVESLTENYTATLAYLERWQQQYLSSLVNGYENRASKESDLFIIVFLFLIITVLLITGIVLLVQNRVLRPLLKAREIVVRMAEERDFIPVKQKLASGELERLFDALNILKARLRERSEMTRQLQHYAETDGLTGLLNRRTFEARAISWIQFNNNQEPLYLVLMDLDHFKHVNDKYGHPTGDNVLVGVAKMLSTFSADNILIGRLGGEEFALLIRHPNIHSVRTITGKVQKALRALTIQSVQGEALKVTGSFGIAGSEEGSWIELLSLSDQALYEAKRQGRDRICVNPVTSVTPG